MLHSPAIIVRQFDCHEKLVFLRARRPDVVCHPSFRASNIWKVYFKNQMVRKTTWSMLLLLLVSVQAFASACDVRCGAMALMGGSAGPRVGMAHCQGMASQTVSDDAAAYTVMPSQPCASHICKNDWLLLSRTTYEFGPSSQPATVLSVAIPFVPVVSSLQWKTDRWTHSIPAFDPILSRLRV
jgi:hypothetical protein